MTVIAEAQHIERGLSRSEFEDAVREATQPLRAFAMRLARNQPDADDLLQEALFRAWRSLSSFRRGSHFTRWTMRILRNVFLNRVRSDKRRPSAVDPFKLEAEDRAPTHPAVVGFADLTLVEEYLDDRVKDAVQALPERFRVPFIMFALGGHKYEEIADALGIPIGTVMSRLHRARTRLRKALGTQSDILPGPRPASRRARRERSA